MSDSIDLRQSRDGVLVLFHDDMLDRLTEGLGTVNQLSYHDLMTLRPRLIHGRSLPCHGPPTFVALLDPESSQPDGDTTFQRRRLERIIARTWAAQNVVGEWKTPQLVGLLEQQIDRRCLHRDFVYHGLDGAMAVRALARIRATKSVPGLIDAFWRVDPELRKVADPQWSQNPLAWTDFRLKMELLTALGVLTCPESKAFLEQYVALEEGKLREVAPPQYEDATKALLRQRLSLDELKALLRHRRSAVRGTAILECLDDPRPDRAQALTEVAPWALGLPGARK